MPLRSLVFPVAWLAAALVPLAVLAEETASGPPPAAPTSGTGAVEGTVVYRPDAKRPWRLSRYYVKNRREGQLAEAVVALRAKSVPRAPDDKPATAVVDQQDYQFTPETTVVRAGDQVKFLNSDGGVHSVLSYDPRHSFNVSMSPGQKHFETFKRAGGTRLPYELGCTYHSAMRAWIFVFGHPYYQLTGPDGRFRLEGIPPGEYELEMAHPAGQLRWSQKITVAADQTTKLDITVSPDNVFEREK